MRSRARRAPDVNAKACGERATGIEPAFSAWEADVLPLNYARGSAENTRALLVGIRPREPRGGGESCRMGYGMPPTSDPTEVMGKRLLAFIIDALLTTGVLVALLALTKDHAYTNAPTGACQT